MSREIKFRSWDNVEMKMYHTGEHEDIHFYFDSGGIVAERYFNAEVPTVEGDIYTSGEYEKLEHLRYMQYTGLKDSKGVEMYEGDICSVYEVMDYGRGLEDKSYITDIKYEEAAFFVKSDTNDYDTFLAGWFPSGGTRYPQIEFEVIGNIYENPELLEEQS